MLAVIEKGLLAIKEVFKDPPISLIDYEDNNNDIEIEIQEDDENEDDIEQQQQQPKGKDTPQLDNHNEEDEDHALAVYTWDTVTKYRGGSKPKEKTDLLYGIAIMDDEWWVPCNHPVAKQLIAHCELTGDCEPMYTHNEGRIYVYDAAAVALTLEHLVYVCEKKGYLFSDQ